MAARCGRLKLLVQFIEERLFSFFKIKLFSWPSVDFMLNKFDAFITKSVKRLFLWIYCLINLYLFSLLSQDEYGCARSIQHSIF